MKIVCYCILLLAALFVMAVTMPFVIIGGAVFALFYIALSLWDKSIERFKTK
jgi:hypothetical protein